MEVIEQAVSLTQKVFKAWITYQAEREERAAYDMYVVGCGPSAGIKESDKAAANQLRLRQERFGTAAAIAWRALEKITVDK